MDCRVKPGNDGTMRLAGHLIFIALLVWSVHANAQAPASPPAPQSQNAPAVQPAATPAPNTPPTADDICRALEQDAAENELPVEFFARVIWQESRFNAQAVSKKGAQGIAQFMPATADYRGLVDPFDPIEALRHSASYLGELRTRFGNLGLAAAAYNAGPGRVAAFLAGQAPVAEPDAQLRRHHHRLDRGRLGLGRAAADRGDHDPARRAVHAARQSDPGAETRSRSASPATCRAGARNSPPTGRRAKPGRSTA